MYSTIKSLNDNAISSLSGELYQKVITCPYVPFFAGENIEIRVEVKDISGNVPEKDKSAIENGIKEYRKEIPDLVLGMYVDISLFVKIGEAAFYLGHYH